MIRFTLPLHLAMILRRCREDPGRWLCGVTPATHRGAYPGRWRVTLAERAGRKGTRTSGLRPGTARPESAPRGDRLRAASCVSHLLEVSRRQ